MSGLSCRSCQVWVRAVTCHPRSNGCSEDVRPVRDGPTVPIQFLYLDIYVIIYIYIYSIHEHIYIYVYYILHIDRYIYIYMYIIWIYASCVIRYLWGPNESSGLGFHDAKVLITTRCWTSSRGQGAKQRQRKQRKQSLVLLWFYAHGQPCFMLPLKIQTSYPTYIETYSLWDFKSDFGLFGSRRFLELPPLPVQHTPRPWLNSQQ